MRTQNDAPRGEAGLPDAAPDGRDTASARFGQVGPVPWSFARTLVGAAVMLVPWMAFVISTAVTTPATTTRPTRLAFAVDLASAIIVFVFTALVEGAFLLVPAYIAVVRRAPGMSAREGLRALGLRGTRLGPAVGAVGAGLAIVFVTIYLYGLAITLLHLPLQTNGTQLFDQARYEPLTVLGILAGSVLIAPFCEEIFFRGFLFAGLLRGLPVWLAAALAAALFAMAHGSVGSAVPLFVIGVVLAIVRWRTGSLWPGMVIHACNNALVLVVVVSALTH